MDHRSVVGVVVACCVAAALAQTPKRGRNEGTMNIPASNVMGNGNITARAFAGGSYGTSEIGVAPKVGGGVGVADIIQLTANLSFPNFVRFGSTDMHLQLTHPGNDKLRFIGAALRGDLYLSTAQDTISSSAAAAKPEYNSHILPSLVVDLDWLAIMKQLPLKTYLHLGMADDPDQLFRYDQLSLVSGLEWKMYRHSMFADAGLGLYREKRRQTVSNQIVPADRSYEQRVLWVEPGGRYRVWNRLSVVGSMRLTLYRQLKDVSPLEPTLFGAAVGIEVPLLFKETNTEAIRTLVFLEQHDDRSRRKGVVERNIEQGKTIRPDFEATFEDLDLGMEREGEGEERADYQKKREEIQRRMEEIEKLFEDLDQ